MSHSFVTILIVNYRRLRTLQEMLSRKNRVVFHPSRAFLFLCAILVMVVHPFLHAQQFSIVGTERGQRSGQSGTDLVSDTTGAGPGQFFLRSPSNSTSNVSVWPEFSWSPSAGATKYYLDISKTPLFSEVSTVAYDCGALTTMRPPVDMVMNTGYFWRVRALDSLGRSATSAADSVTLSGSYFYLTTQAPSIERELRSEVPLPYNRTLRPENTPYVLRGGADLSIPAARSLTIRKGTTLKVDGPYGIIVDGTFCTLGEGTDTVRITSYKATPTVNDWKYIQLNPGSRTTTYDLNGNYVSGSVIQGTDISWSNGLVVNRDSLLIDGVSIHNTIRGLNITANHIQVRNAKFSTCSTSGVAGGAILCNGNENCFFNLTLTNCLLTYVETRYDWGFTILTKGGGIALFGNKNRIDGLSADNVSLQANVNNSGGSSTTSGICQARGGLLCIVGDSCVVTNCRISNSTASFYLYHNNVDVGGGGIAILGNFNTVRDAYLSANTTSYSGNHFYTASSLGGALFISGNGNSILNSTILSNSSVNGGGLYVTGAGNLVSSVTSSGNSATTGGGIWTNDANMRIVGCTITNNRTASEGGGIYGGRWIQNSFISGNVVPDTSLGGGIFGDPDSISFCNINRNKGYQVKKNAATTTYAVNNWWLTRNDLGQILRGIYDKTKSQSLGYAYYQPILTDESPYTPGKFSTVTSVTLYDDSTYSLPLTRTVGLGDVVYAEVVGADRNIYARNVSVLSVTDLQTGYPLRPFSEELADSSGRYRFRFYLKDTWFPEDSILVYAGDTLSIFCESDRSVKILLPIGTVVRGSMVRPLSPGWNLMSWNLDTSNDSTQAVFRPVLSHITSVLGFDSVGLAYSPSLPLNVNSLQFVDQFHGYWVKTLDSTALDVTGVVVDPQTPMTLRNGYNLVSYLPTAPDSVQHALGSLGSSLIRVLGFDGGALTYDPALPPSVQTLSILQPGFGYWVLLSGSSMLTYPILRLPSQAGRLAYETVKRTTSSPDSNARIVTPSNEWMSVWGVGIRSGTGLLPAGSEVTALNQRGVVCGRFVVSQPGVIGLMAIYKDDPSTPQDEGVRNGEQFTIAVSGQPTSLSLRWTTFGDVVDLSKTLTGITDAPSVPLRFELRQNYPNPFNPSTRIDYVLPQSSQVRISVYSLLGEEIAVLKYGVENAGSHSVVWEGQTSQGSAAASGIYFCRVKAGDQVKTIKMILLR